MNWRTRYEATVSITHSAQHGPLRHLRVQRRDGRDGITWDTLQRIKDDVLGTDVVAVEIYPAQENLVNEINARHLWEVPTELIDFGLGRR